MQRELLNASQAQLKKWARLHDSKFRNNEGIFIAEGIKVVEELLLSDWQIEALLIMPEKIKYQEKLLLPVARNTPVYQLTRSQWQKIGQDREPEGIMAVVVMQQAPDFFSWLTAASGNILILHETNNPRNLGALMRSALWFGFQNIVMSAGSVDFTHPKVVRSSMGSLFHLKLIFDTKLEKVLPEIKRYYYLLGSNVHQGVLPHPLTKRAALILGSESHGLPEDLLALTDEQWSIPGRGKIDSLSLPQAATIMMYEMAKKT